MYDEMATESPVFSTPYLFLLLLFLLLLFAEPSDAVRGCTVIAIQPDLRWKKAVCDSDTSLLTKIPPDLPENLISLRITQQSIRRLDDGELRKLVFLEELRIDSCELEQVDAKVFEGLNHLRILSLRNNSIRLDENGLLPSAFYHLTALEVLDISENPLGRIPPNFFPNSLGKSLLEIRISNIKGDFPLKLEASTFAVLRNLQVLDMSFCRLETLSSDFRSVFHRMEKLRELQLGGNPWHCDCNLRWLREWYLSDTLPSMILSYEQKTDFGTPNIVAPTCKSPSIVKRRQIFIPSGRGAIEPSEFVCKQWIDSREKHVATILGSNVSLICQGYFESRKPVQWFKNHLPLVNPSPNYIISQSNALDFVAMLNITSVRYEDGGIWECGLDDGSILQKASINVTVKLATAAGSISRMDEAQRQNLVYAGIGVAIVFILLAVVALTVFFCWGKHGAEKSIIFSRCKLRFQKNNSYGLGMTTAGDDARELIGTRVASSHPDSPVALKNTSKSQEAPITNHISPNKPVSTTNSVSTSQVTCVTSSVSTPKFISLTTATTTTAVLTQPTPATLFKQPTSPHSTLVLATDFSSPSNTSITANGAEFYQLPLSGGYGTVSLPSRLFAQIAGSANNSNVPSANNPFLISTPCPIHGLNSKLSSLPKEQPPPPPQQPSIFDACPIHGSPSSVASRGSKRVASSFTQTPRRATKSKSSTSLRAPRQRRDRWSYHTKNVNNTGRRDSFGSHQGSSSSTQYRYRTLPSRLNSKTIAACPIHGQFASSLLKRRSSSMIFDQNNQLGSSRNRKTQSITVDVPFCSSCESHSSTSSSSEGTVPAGTEFEEYSSEFSQSPVAEFSDSASSDYIESIRPQAQRGNTSIPASRNRYNARPNYRDSSSTSSRAEETGDIIPSSVFSDDPTDRNSLSLISENKVQNRILSTPRTILGEPLVLTSMDCAGASNALISRSLHRSRESLKKQSPRKNTPNPFHHSRDRETIPSSSSSNQMAPKSILVKNSSHRRHRRRSSDFHD